MAKFIFYKHVKVTSWVKDKYEVEAESQEEAEDLVRENDDIEDIGEFVERDMDTLLNCMSEGDYHEIYNEYGEEIY